MSDDLILDSLFEGEEFADEEVQSMDEYGKGKWPNAVLVEVDTQEARDFGRGIKFKVNLKGDEGMAFTFFQDAPFQPEENGDHDAYERKLKGYEMNVRKLKTIIHATGLFCTFNERGYAEKKQWPKAWTDFRDELAYDKLVSALRQRIGHKLPVKVSYRTYTKASGEQASTKDVWGMEARAEG